MISFICSGKLRLSKKLPPHLAPSQIYSIPCRCKDVDLKLQRSWVMLFKGRASTLEETLRELLVRSRCHLPDCAASMAKEARALLKEPDESLHQS